MAIPILDLLRSLGKDTAPDPACAWIARSLRAYIPRSPWTEGPRSLERVWKTQSVSVGEFAYNKKFQLEAFQDSSVPRRDKSGNRVSR